MARERERFHMQCVVVGRDDAIQAQHADFNKHIHRGAREENTLTAKQPHRARELRALGGWFFCIVSIFGTRVRSGRQPTTQTGDDDDGPSGLTDTMRRWCVHNKPAECMYTIYLSDKILYGVKDVRCDTARNYSR